MGGETERSVSGWTVDTLKEYVERLARDQKESLKDAIELLDKLYKERDEARTTAVNAALAAAQVLNTATFSSQEKAVEKAETNSEKWRQSANEWRDAMNDRENKFASRTEMASELGAIRAVIATLEKAMAAGGGAATGVKAVKDESRANIALMVAVVGAILAIAARFIR